MYSRRLEYYRGLNNYPYHLDVRLRYHRPYLYKEYGTMILVIIQAPILRLLFPLIWKEHKTCRSQDTGIPTELETPAATKGNLCHVQRCGGAYGPFMGPSNYL